MKNLKIKILFVLFLFVTTLCAQQISIPFSCGFEDSTEISNWVINAGPNGNLCNDQWMIGNLEYNEGYQSMYVSCDSGRTSNYGHKPNVVIAYRTIEIPSSLDPNKASYSVDISFDYKCVGENNVSFLNFYLLPASFISKQDILSSANGATMPTKLSKTSLVTLNGMQEWTTWSTPRPQTLPVDQQFYLIFVWQNSNTDTAVVVPQAPCIDNIQITSSNCWKPTDLETSSSCDTLWVSWEGVNEMYEFEYRPSGAKTWRGNQTLKAKEVMLTNILEGAYDVRVRGICGDEKSAWVTKNNAISFCPDRHCINYVSLDRTGVVCEIGSASDPTKTRPSIYPTGLGQSLAGPVDYGSNDKRSRHTINWKQGEYDIRTGNKLRTIPEGSLASVRLGNWDINRQAEGITYDYYVDTTTAFILLMKYAVVLEAPGHGPSSDPYFKLEIIDEMGNVIDPTCGEFEFTPENKNIKWNKSGGFVWKDWTSIGLNLSAFHGQNIQIRLVTQDCLLSAHSGYAYFTLDCADAAIKSTSCGETVNMEMIAPDGFSYIWTRRENRDSVISTERQISVPANDTTTYYCEVDYIDLEGCGFTLFTSVYPRFPFADYVYEHTPENCENRITFTNKSCVHTKVDGVETPTAEKCETFYWSINDGEYESSIENLVYDVPREGDTLKVTLMVGISDDACQDDTTFYVVVPPIYEHNDTIYETLCEGNTCFFDNRLLAISGVYAEYKKNIWGCDSITVLDLKFAPQPEDVHVYDTICSNDVYMFNGKEITESGDYEVMLPAQYGCDSIVILHLEKLIPLGVDVEDEYRFACEGDGSIKVDFDFVDGMRAPTEYSLVYGTLEQGVGFVDQTGLQIGRENSLNIELPNPCRPNSYSVMVVFKDTTGLCGDISIPINFDVYYSSSILQAKFNSLITVLNAENNGGYSFVDGEYKWYRNGQEMEGDSLSYFYLEEGETFGAEDCFYFVATRTDDGVEMRSCEICPGGGTPVEEVFDSQNFLPISLFRSGDPIVFENVQVGVASIYTIAGQLVSEFDISEGTQIVAPMQAGTYLLRLRTNAYSVVYKIQVR